MKKQQTVDEYAELNSAIRLAAKDAGPKTTSREAAQALLESARELIDRFASFLLIEELAGRIRRERAKLRPPPIQRTLGFKALPLRVTSEGGARVNFESLKLTESRRLRAEQWKRKDPVLEEWDRALKLHARYAKKDHDITFGEVLQKELKKKGESA